MPDNFQQTVDLREQMEKRREATRRSAKNPATPIEKIYSQTGADEPSSDLKKISRLKTARPSGGGYRWLTFFLAILVIAASFYFLFFSRWPGESADPKQKNWYAVKLADGEIFYGQIADVKADPVVIANVYYDYDQARRAGSAADSAKTIEETGNLRLVKRGKETHGPDGTINVVRAQVLFMEPLKDNSKVLQAILGYEK